MLNLVAESDWVDRALCRGQDPNQWGGTDASDGSSRGGGSRRYSVGYGPAMDTERKG